MRRSKSTPIKLPSVTLISSLVLSKYVLLSKLLWDLRPSFLGGDNAFHLSKVRRDALRIADTLFWSTNSTASLKCVATASNHSTSALGRRVRFQVFSSYYGMDSSFCCPMATNLFCAIDFVWPEFFLKNCWWILFFKSKERKKRATPPPINKLLNVSPFCVGNSFSFMKGEKFKSISCEAARKQRWLLM